MNGNVDETQARGQPNEEEKRRPGVQPPIVWEPHKHKIMNVSHSSNSDSYLLAYSGPSKIEENKF